MAPPCDKGDTSSQNGSDQFGSESSQVTGSTGHGSSQSSDGSNGVFKPGMGTMDQGIMEGNKPGMGTAMGGFKPGSGTVGPQIGESTSQGDGAAIDQSNGSQNQGTG